MNARTRWISTIIGMLSFPVVLYGFAFAITANDPSFRVDRGYKQRTEAYDEELIQREANARLGWTLDVADDPESGVVVARLRDRDGRPIDGAMVEIEVFHAARSARTVRLSSSAMGDGRYGAAFAATQTGQHVVRAVVTKGSDRFIVERRFWADGSGRDGDDS